MNTPGPDIETRSIRSTGLLAENGWHRRTLRILHPGAAAVVLALTGCAAVHDGLRTLPDDISVTTPRPVAPGLLPQPRKTGGRASGTAVNCLPTPRGLECFAQRFVPGTGQGNDAIAATYSGQGWSSWESLGGAIRANVSCHLPGPLAPGNEPDDLTCLATGLDGNIWLIARDGGVWNAHWTAAPARQIGNAVSCMPAPYGSSPRHYCFARDASGQLVYSRWQMPDYATGAPIARSRWIEATPARLISDTPRCRVSMESGYTWATCDAPSGRDEVRWRAPIGPAETGQSSWQRIGSSIPHWQIEVNGSLLPTSCVDSISGRNCFYVHDARLWRLSAASATSVIVPGTEHLIPEVRCVQMGNIHCLVRNGAREIIHYELAP